ncbi:sugar ABC transporter permease, partial [Burkholderia cenocepacia]
DWLPSQFQKIVLLLPTVHGTEMLRGGYFGSLVKPHYDISYMVWFDMSLLLVGLLLVRDAGTRVEPE